jgi:PleD family two-component response regulator
VNTKDITVLLIDNSIKDIERFVDVFSEEKISILAAVSIKKAKSILKYLVPDLIISEVTLEDGDGYEMLNFMKDHSDYAGTPLIFLSEDNVKQKIKLLSLGAEDYFTKPYSAEELKIRIQRVIKRVSVRRFDIDRKIFSATSCLNIVEIMQLLDGTQKSGVLTIFTSHRVGLFHFAHGNIVRGKFGPYTGREAVYQILAVKDAIYEFEFKKEEYKAEIHHSTQSVILDGLKILDESGGKDAVAEAKESDKFEIFCVGIKKSQILHLFDENAYNIMSYEDPQRSLKMLDNIAPDLIIVNPDMPCLSGVSYLEILGENPITYQLPVVFFGSGMNEDEKISALRGGAADYIFSHITKYEFDVKIRKIINEGVLRKKEYSNVLRGSLNNFSVIELIQGVQKIEKTCMVTFYNGDDSCTLFFTNGGLTNAKIQHHEGEEAIYKIMMWSRGYFDIRFKDYPSLKAVKKSTFSLVLDGISKTQQKEEEEVEKIIAISSKTAKAKTVDVKKDFNIGFYNFILETAKLKLSDELVFSSIRIGGVSRFLDGEEGKDVLIIDLNLVEKDALDELLSLKEVFYEKIQQGMIILCFASPSEIYDVQGGVLNKFSWLINYDETKKVKEVLSDYIVSKTEADFFEFNEIKDKMYHTVAFPHGFGSPEYSPILFSTDDIPVALYQKIGNGYTFLMPQVQSKEEFVNFFIEKVLKKSV